VIGLSVAITQGGRTRHREAVVMLTNDVSRPYLTYLWR
jgi:hypothetical protein